MKPFDPNWSAEEAWKNGYNADGTPRTDDAFFRELAVGVLVVVVVVAVVVAVVLLMFFLVFVC